MSLESASEIAEEMLVRFFLNQGELSQVEFGNLCMKMNWWLEDVLKVKEQSDLHTKILTILADKFGVKYISPHYTGVVCVAIFNSARDKVLVVEGFGQSFTFPKGKVEQGETKIFAACREVLEETGIDISCRIKESQKVSTKRYTIYYVDGIDIPGDKLKSCHRCEINAIQWWNVSEVKKKTKNDAKRFLTNGNNKWVTEKGNKVLVGELENITYFSKHGKLPK